MAKEGSTPVKQGVQSYLDRLSEYQPLLTHAVVFNTNRWQPVQPPLGSQWDYDAFVSREAAEERLGDLRPGETEPELWERRNGVWAEAAA